MKYRLALPVIVLSVTFTDKISEWSLGPTFLLCGHSEDFRHDLLYSWSLSQSLS